MLARAGDKRDMRALGSLTLLTIWLAPVTGCGWPNSGAGGLDQEPEELPILWQKAGSYCGCETPLRLVARDQAEMALCPISGVPVDFNKEMVLVAAMGRVPSPEYAIRINHVYREGPIIKVDVQLFQPQVAQRQIIELATPYHVVVVPRSDLNVEGFSPDAPRARQKEKSTPILRF